MEVEVKVIYCFHCSLRFLLAFIEDLDIQFFQVFVKALLILHNAPCKENKLKGSGSLGK